MSDFGDGQHPPIASCDCENCIDFKEAYVPRTEVASLRDRVLALENKCALYSASLKKADAEIERLRSALLPIAARCAQEHYGEGRCPEVMARAMGGALSFEEQRRGWCVGCTVRAALNTDET